MQRTEYRGGTKPTEISIIRELKSSKPHNTTIEYVMRFGFAELDPIGTEGDPGFQAGGWAIYEHFGQMDVEILSRPIVGTLLTMQYSLMKPFMEQQAVSLEAQLPKDISVEDE